MKRYKGWKSSKALIKKRIFFVTVQVFDLRFSPIMFGKDDNFPIVAIVAPYRSLFKNIDSYPFELWMNLVKSQNFTISAFMKPYNYRDRPLQLWTFLEFFRNFLETKDGVRHRVYIVNQTDSLPFNRHCCYHLRFGFQHLWVDFSIIMIPIPILGSQYFDFEFFQDEC